MYGMEYVLKIPQAKAESDQMKHLKQVMTEMVSEFKGKAHPDDKIGIVLRNQMSGDKPIALSFRFVHQLAADTLFGLVSRVAQSNAQFFLSGHLNATVHLVNMPRGRGRSKNRVCDRQSYISSKKGILKIKHTGPNCLAHALYLGYCYALGIEDPKLVQKDTVELEVGVSRLCELAGITLNDGGGVEELLAFQRVMPENVQIVVYTQLNGKNPFFKIDQDEVDHRINLLLSDGHYDVILSCTSAFSTGYYCQACNTPYNDKNVHNCGELCPCCHNATPCNANKPMDCNDCNRTFRSYQCYINHKENMTSAILRVCDTYRCCATCLRSYKMYKGRPQHVCGEFFCKGCKTYKPSLHECYMQPDKCKEAASEEGVLYCFYDIETTQEKPLSEQETDGFEHEANLLIAHTVCFQCMYNDDIRSPCSLCGDRLHVFTKNPVGAFLKFITAPRKKFNRVIAVAHNAGSFDAILLLRYIITVLHLVPELIMRGAKILLMKLGHVHFKDSLNFMSLPLASLPEALDIKEIKKGNFPHYFNLAQHANYKGPIPAAHYFGVDDMKGKQRDKFLQWYNIEVKKNATYDFQSELHAYCQSDVDILRKACLKFSKLIVDMCKVNPFIESLTMASTCSKIYRRNFLPKDKISLIPVLGYRMMSQQSLVAIKWLISEENRLGIKIVHAGHSAEYRLPSGHLVDGYAVIDGKETVFEFFGCFFHAHTECMPLKHIPVNNDKNDTPALRRERTDKKLRELRALNYKVIFIWECEFKQVLRDDPALKNYLDSHPIVANEPLRPREALYGGRTEAFTLYAKAGPDEEIRYYDVLSLYPFVCKYGKFIVGHPKIHTCAPFPDLQKIDGLIKCEVLPPKNLLLPVLPYRVHDRLMFVLCRSCAEALNQGECTHSSVGDRSFIGVYVLDELRLALSKGYSVVRIFEIWEYHTEQYDPISKTGGLFTQYINLFLKVKQEASGYPAWCTTEALKDQYIQTFFEKEGILLEKEKIIHNPGLRTCGKFALNLLWGRFSLNPQRTETVVVNDAQEFFALLCNPNLEIKRVLTMDDQTIVVNYEKLQEALHQDTTVNVVIAAFVTAGARIHLYSYMEQANARLIYTGNFLKKKSKRQSK
jgi:G:T-mismatch repair DNA endonuclease (very short patch repair protein)